MRSKSWLIDWGVEVAAGGVGEHPVVGAVGEAVADEPAPPTAEKIDGAVVELDAASAGAGLAAELDGLAPDALEGAADGKALR